MDKAAVKAQVLEAFNFRHACKRFDDQKSIEADDFDFILETGRLSPTSFGMQGCRMIVITDPALKAGIKKAAWNQDQVDSCSHLVVYLTRTKALEPGSDWVKSRFADRGMPQDRQEAYYKRYSDFHGDLQSRLAGMFKRGFVNFFYALFHKDHGPRELYHWGAKQCYILLGNMMSAAAMIGIDSCPLEGFSKNSIEEILSLDTAQEEVVVMAAFGYRAGEGSVKRRLSLETLCQWR